MKITALAGGVGGAKLADGLAQVLPKQDLTIIVNTGDDFEHMGLYVCPDLDTVCYTLAGLANPQTGWGRKDESWSVFENLAALGGPTWFRLGDRDLATHLERTRRLKRGDPLSQITKDFCAAWEIGPKILPMSDQAIPTIVLSDQGELAFQDYFVAQRCEPVVSGFRFEGAENAKPAEGVLDSILEADLVVICPSNPWVSIAPILAVPGIRQALKDRPVLAVSPIIAGKAVKGPAAKMFAELGIQPSALAVAEYYSEIITAFVADTSDEDSLSILTKPTLCTQTLMQSREDRKNLAQEVISFFLSIRESKM